MATAALANTNKSPPSAWNQLDQLLTCAICLDRYRNPKLLPCQHTFCMEPCLEGLIDYVRRQIKCPECRAEHRIPYQGIQGYPTNVTLMRFLELHFEVTGEVPDPTPTIMERCGVCSEKSYLTHCSHCDKKVCTDCKEAHLDIMKREISRINNQVKRGLNRLQDALSQTEKSSQQMQSNCKAIVEEIEEMYHRLQKELRDREETLKNEVETFLQAELRGAEQLKENLELEISNIQSNTELAENHVTENSDWNDMELVEYKETFLKTLEFLRNFDPDQSDFNKRLKFQLGPDPEAFHQSIITCGELIINAPNFPGSCVTSTVGIANPGLGMLMRSKSEHRLVTIGRHDNYLNLSQKAVSGHSSDNDCHDGRTSPLSRRRGELGDRRSSRDHDEVSERFGGRRYGREFGDLRPWQREDADHGLGHKLRFGRDTGELQRDLSEPDISSSRLVRFARQHQEEQAPEQIKEKLFETEDATRGPLSGISRLLDCPRVMLRLQQQEQREKQQQLIKSQQPSMPTSALVSMPISNPSPVLQSHRPSRQMSEDDEISKQKAQNKAQGTSSSPLPQAAVAPALSDATQRSSSSFSEAANKRRPLSRQTSRDIPDATPERPHPPGKPMFTTERGKDVSSGDAITSLGTSSTDSLASKKGYSSGVMARGNAGDTAAASTLTISEDTDSDSESESDSGTPSKISSNTNPGALPSQSSTTEDINRSDKPNYFRFRSAQYSRSPSNSSVNQTDSPDEVQSPASVHSPRFAQPPATKYAIDEGKIKRNESTDSTTSSTGSEPSSSGNTNPAPSKTPINSGALRRRDPPKIGSSMDSNSRSFDSKDDGPALTEKGHPAKPRFVSRFLPRVSSVSHDDKDDSSSDSEDDSKSAIGAHSPISALLARSANARRDNVGRRDGEGAASGHDSFDRPDPGGRQHGKGSSYLHGRDQYKKDDSNEGRYSSLSSKYLTRSRPSLTEDDRDNPKSYGVNRYLSKSKSSAALGSDKDDLDDGPRRPSRNLGGSTDAQPSRYGGSGSKRNQIGRSKSSHDINGGEEEEEDSKDSGAYGTGSAYRSTSQFERPYDYRSRSQHALNPKEPNSEDSSSSSLSSWARYLRNKYGNKGKSEKDYQPIGRSRSSHTLYSREASSESSEEETGVLSHNATRRSSTVSSPGYKGLTRSHAAGDNPRSAYTQKQKALMTIGKRGSEQGCFTWPRGVAVGPDNSIVVADSSNHRVQIFDAQGNFCKEFGIYGSSDGEFDCLAGVAVNRIGQYIISDRYNHRIQVFDPSGRFLRAFANQGSADGKLSYPWGIATDSLGFIYVCDKENHRIQVFQSDGTFVGKFGSLGNQSGQLEHPHYIAVSNTNKVLVSDSNNHRIQIFDVNGRVHSTFGSEGTERGQFKFPRGIAVDDQGVIIVGDSGNNRIQVFSPDGTYIKSFGTWGSGDGEFKGLEGVAVTSNGNILVCDRENHRIQVF